jgi:myo-inositol-1(or 4)-monophosphatase
MPNLEKLLIHAEAVARQAGAALKLASKAYLKVNFQSDKDVKLQADVESEAIIRRELSALTGLPIIGEENGGDESLLEQDTLYWVVDPLDGTYNYLRNQPFCCVSIGLMRGKEPILGVIYDFNRDVLYSGIAHQGITLNNEPVQPGWVTEKSTACLITGFPSGRNYATDSLQSFIHQIQSYNKIRMIGSAALALAYVAVGYADMYYEESIRLWDIAAGAALVLAAGGACRIQPAQSEIFLGFNVCAAAREEWLI